MQLSGARILITGGSGFVGTPSASMLLTAGATVRVLDLSPPQFEHESGVDVVLGDITDPDVVDHACEGIDAVLHLAVVPLTAANEHHEPAFDTNVRGSFNVLHAAGVAGVQRVVYASASSAYGPTDAVPIGEDHPLLPTAFYPATKAAAEMLLRGLAGSFGYGFALLRYMNVYGPGQRDGVVPAIVRAARSGEPPVLTGDGTQAFDFVHVDDCARANVLAVESDVTGEAFNIGCGSATSLNELVAIIGRLLKRELPPDYSGAAVSTPPRVGDVAKARELLRFSAETGLTDGLASVLREAQCSA